MKTLRQVIKELQEFGVRENAMDLPLLIASFCEDHGVLLNEPDQPEKLSYEKYKHFSDCMTFNLRDIGEIVVL